VVPTPQMQRVSGGEPREHASVFESYRGTGPILRLFRSEGIVALPYKGPVLAAQAYGDVLLRQFDDVDIIVPGPGHGEGPWRNAETGLFAKVSGPMSPDLDSPLVPGEYKYYSEARRAIVELHTEQTLRHFPLRPILTSFRRGASLSILAATTCTRFHRKTPFWQFACMVRRISGAHSVDCGCVGVDSVAAQA